MSSIRSSSSSSSSRSRASMASEAEKAKTPGAGAKKTPQEAIDEFWAHFTTKHPGKATTVIPHNTYTEIVAKKSNKASVTTTKASYEDAAAMCRAKVDKIVKECRRINKKYRDPHFDLEADLKYETRDCLQSLSNVEDSTPGTDMVPESVKRVADIFDDAKFYIDGPTTNDVRQGRNGDCWLMAALCTLSNKEGLIERLCVAHDTACGVYGFVFHRDGEWISEIVDDFLYLTKPDYDESYMDRVAFNDITRNDPEEAYRRTYQTNSGALYFAQCAHPQETWLPLLEKCYAKAHGDYAAIEGGFGGEGIEDLTGGVTSEVWTTDILDKEHFWREELLKVNKDFLFGCSTGVFPRGWGERRGIVESHAYSIQKAVEIEGKRLLKLKNPWGKGEWKGPWSDGSKEWTPEWLKKLDHQFGDDGDFWIEYSDLLRKYQAFERTRLFASDWRVTQTWTTFTVPWTLDYQDTYFTFAISEPGPVVIVLAQLDDRYFRGLEGQYCFKLGFRLHKAGQEDYIVRSQTPYRMTRSVNVELDLEAGEYEVRVRIDANRDQDILPIDEVIRRNAKNRRDKLIRIGLAYDLSHSKGRIVESSAEKAAKVAHEKKEKDKQRAEIRKKYLKEREENYYLKVKDIQREQKRTLKGRQRTKARAAARKAKQEAAKTAKAARKAARKAAKETSGVKESEKAMVSGNGNTDVASKDNVKDATPTTDEKHDDISSPDTVGDSPVDETSSIKDDSTTPTNSKTTKEENTADDSKETEIKVKDIVEEGMTTSDSKGIDDKAKDTTEEVKDVSSDSLDTPNTEEVQANGEKKATVVDSDSSEAECESEIDDDLSSIDSLDELSERELELQVTALEPAPPPDPEPVTEEPDEFEQDPWNAVAVVGLRVYHKVASGDKAGEVIQLNVVRPDPYTEDTESKDPKRQESKETVTKGLDVDDSAKDATLEGGVKERKISILGEGRKNR
ncbi:hypothetical protein G7046_g903 [Stylonectria norvegica]|nr:hypothetical protein G7046_g903 [Stylonectria norvegica]